MHTAEDGTIIFITPELLHQINTEANSLVPSTASLNTIDDKAEELLQHYIDTHHKGVVVNTDHTVSRIQHT